MTTRIAVALDPIRAQEILAVLSDVQGVVTVLDGMATLEDGSTLDLSPYRAPAIPSLSQLAQLWRSFADVPLNGLDQTEVSWHSFPAGTDRETIWRWFEAQNPAFVVGEVLTRGLDAFMAQNGLQARQDALGDLMSQDEFRSLGGRFCPVCRGSDLHEYEAEIISPGGYRNISCANKECRHHWTEAYVLSGYEQLQDRHGDDVPYPKESLSLADQACQCLVRAYRLGLVNGGSVDWEDVDQAHATAREALGLTEPDEVQDCQICGESFIVEGACATLFGQPVCPDCHVDDAEHFVTCKFCGHLAPMKTAHLHEGQWVGEACCWDERLRATQ